MRCRYNLPQRETEAGSRKAQGIQGHRAECHRAIVTGRSLQLCPFHATSGSHWDPVFRWLKRLEFKNHYFVVHFAKNCSNVHMSGANFQEGKLA